MERMQTLLANITIHNVDLDLLNEQYLALINTLDAGHAGWGLVELIGDVLQQKGYHLA